MITRESRSGLRILSLKRTRVALCLVLGASLAAAPAQAGLSFKKGSFTKSTGAAPVSQSVTSVGFQPQAVIFFWTRQTTQGSASDSYFGIGFTTGSSNERTVAYQSQDSRGNVDSRTYQSQTQCIVIVDRSTGLLAGAELTSLDADGFTINWTTNEARADIIHYVALGGSDLTNATASSFTVTTGAGSQSVTGLGFQPDFLMFLSAKSSTMDSQTNDANLSVGFASGASAEAGIGLRSDDASDPSDTCVQQRTDNAIVEITSCPSTANKLIDLTSFDSGGFTLNKTTATSGTVVHYLALKGGQFKVGSFNKDTNTGVPVDQTVSGVGFRPVGLLLAANGLASSTSIQANSRMGFGATDGPPDTITTASEGAIWFHDEDGVVSDSDTYMRTTTSKTLQKADNGTLQAEADTKAFSSGSFTLTWTTNDAVASEILYVAFGHTSTSAVTMERMAAVRRSDGRVAVRWRTRDEINNLGFHVYREGPDGVRLRLTPELVTGSAFLAGPGHALTSGRRYRVWDNVGTLNDERGALNAALSPQSSALNPSVRYWIEDVDLNGTRTMHGPIIPIARGTANGERGEEFSVPPSSFSLSASALSPQHSALPLSGGAPQLPRTVALPEPTPEALARHVSWITEHTVKLLVRREGWQRVGRDALLTQGVPSGVDPRTFRLFVDAQELPIRVSGETDGRLDPGDTLAFYGLGLDTPTTDTRVYWLTWGQGRGLRLPAREASIVKREAQGPLIAQSSTLSPQSFPFTVEVAPQRLYVAAIKNGEAENFYGGVVRQSGVEFPVTLAHVDPAGPAILDLTLQGFTEQTHAVTVSVNGAVIDTLTFRNQELVTRHSSLVTGVLHEGLNTVRLQATGDETDVSLIAQLHLTYAHTNQVTGDARRVTVPAGQPVTLTGFIHPEILVLDVTDPDAPLRLAGRVASSRTGGYAVTTVPTGSGLRTLYVVSPLGAQQPAVLPRVSHGRLPAGGAELTVISPAAWIEDVIPLVQRRRSQGLRVQIVALEALYEQLSFGHTDPTALKRFLTGRGSSFVAGRTRDEQRETSNDLGTRPAPSASALSTQHSALPRLRYALLIGNASLDPRDYLGQQVPDILPTKLIETAVLETASDDWFGDVDNDGIPEVVVGRLPVRTREALRLVLQKLLTAQPQPGALLVSDNSDSYDFLAATTQLQTQLPPGQPVTTLTVDPTNPAASKAALLAQFHHGPALVHYLGHGSVGIWAGEGILTSEDAQTLTNGTRLPIVVALNCLNSFFHDVYTESLGEALLTAPQGGAQAVWASSGMTAPAQQIGLDAGFFGTQPGRRLGDRIRAAKAAVSDPDVRRTWVLLGDPTTPLP